jgi:uncharacterized protein
VSSGRSRIWAFAAVIGSLALGAVTRPAILRLKHPRPRFPYASVPLSSEAYDELAARAGWAKAVETVAPGVSLRGLVRRPTRNDAPWVLFFPGNDASQLTAGQALLEQLRGDRDWGLVVYSYRGYDSSDGTPSPDTLAQDGYVVLQNVIVKERVEPSRLHVVAFSLGGYVAASAVGKAARAGTKVRSLSILAPAADMEMVHSMWRARLVLGDVIDMFPLADDLPGPVLLLHGVADKTIPIEQGRAFAARLGARARLQELPGVGHAEINESPEALEAVRAVIAGSDRRAGP